MIFPAYPLGKRLLPKHSSGHMGNILSLIRCNAKSLFNRHDFEFHELATPAGNPLPPVIHQQVQQQDLGAGRLVVVGDVHGCFDELQQLLNKLEFQQGRDNLVLVGDLVNKGPKSSEVVAAVRSWCASSHCWCVRGNHDDAALAARRHIKQGQGSVKTKYQWVQQLQPEDEQFMTELPFSLEIQGYHILVVHAGLLPDVPLHQQQLSHMTKMRDVQQAPDGRYTGLEKAANGSMAWATTWKGPQHVFFGHDAKRRLQHCTYATGLDTGCVYGGQLTACVLPPLASLHQDSRFLAAATCSEQAAMDGQSARQAAAGDGLRPGVHNAGSTLGATSGCSQGRVQGLTLEHLQGQIIDVSAAVAYEKPGRKSVEAVPSDMPSQYGIAAT